MRMAIDPDPAGPSGHSASLGVFEPEPHVLDGALGRVVEFGILAT